MDVIFIGIFVTVGLLVLAFISYAVTTKNIIKSQEQEIEILKRDNERLRGALSGARYVTKLVLDPEPTTNPSAIIRKSSNDLFKEF